MLLKMALFLNKRSVMYLLLVLLVVATWEHFFDLLQWSQRVSQKYFEDSGSKSNEEVPVLQLELNCGVRQNCPANKFPIFLSTASSVDNLPRLCVAGRYVIKPQTKYEGRGLNGAVVNSETFKVLSVRNFDTHRQNCSDAIKTWIDGISNNDIIIIFTSDEASNKLTDDTKDLLNTLGSGRVQNLQYRSQWYMITQKGTSGITVYEKITYSKKQIWGETIEFRGCVPRTIPKKSTTADDPLKQNKNRIQFCEGKSQEEYRGFCNEPRFELIMPALMTNRSLLSNEAYAAPIFMYAGDDLEVFISSLDNMIHQAGVVVSLITVLYDSDSNDIPSLAKIYGVHSNRTKFADGFEGRLKQSRRLSRKLYPKKKYLIVLDPEVIPSPDFLYFFSQLISVFEKDSTVSAISAWSCNCYGHEGSLHTAYRAVGAPKYGALISAKSRQNEFRGDIFIPDVARLQGPEACHFPSLESNTWIDRPQDLSKDLYYHKLVMLQQLGHAVEEEDILNSCSASAIKKDINIIYAQSEGDSVSKILKCLGILNDQYGMYNGTVRLTVNGTAVMIITSESSFYKSRPIGSA